MKVSVMEGVNQLKFREIHPLPLGEGRVRVSGFAHTCDPHPPRQPAGCRGALSQRERASPPLSKTLIDPASN
jgi:hypothetical protein